MLVNTTLRRCEKCGMLLTRDEKAADMTVCKLCKGKVATEIFVYFSAFAILAGMFALMFLMNGGRLVIQGNAGPWAASGMRAGHLEITGSVGDRLGGPLAGEVAGMRGGVVLVGGGCGCDTCDDRRPTSGTPCPVVVCTSSRCAKFAAAYTYKHQG